jgi:acyl carrier protein
MDASTLEERTLALVAAVLGKEPAYIDAGFEGGLVDIGYTSLQAVQLNRALEDEFNREINILDIVDAQSVEEIYALVSTAIADHFGSPPDPRRR